MNKTSFIFVAYAKLVTLKPAAHPVKVPPSSSCGSVDGELLKRAVQLSALSPRAAWLHF